MSDSSNSPQPDLPAGLPPLVETLRGLILQARQKVLTAANAAQVRTYWEIGRHIVEFEQGSAARADYGSRLLPRLAERLTGEFGRGFDASNLHKMKQFYLSFPILDALRPKLSWTHYRLLLRLDAPIARQWYLDEAATQNWSSRMLERQIASLAYERLLSSQNPSQSLPEVAAPQSPAAPTTRDFIRDPVMLEFLGLPDTGRLLESELENALTARDRQP